MALLGFAIALVTAQRLARQEPQVFGLEDPAELIQEDLANVGGVNKVGQTGSSAKVSDTSSSSGGVESIVPEFEDKDVWEHADKFMRDSYYKANNHYKKINKEEYEAQGQRRKELSHKAEVAYKDLTTAKEAMQKKYAKDDPTDYMKKFANSADRADEKRYKVTPVKLGGTGTWGSSGDPDKQKWYSDGVISSDGWVDTKGHYLIGQHRRRVGAGFGRRRGANTVDSLDKTPSGSGIKKIEAGHPLLKEAFGDPKKVDAKKEEEVATEPKILKDAGVKIVANAPKKDTLTVAEKEAIVDAALAKKGLVEPHKENLTAADKKGLQTTGAGPQPIVDKEGHMTKAVDAKIAGKEVAQEIVGSGNSEA